MKKTKRASTKASLKAKPRERTDRASEGNFARQGRRGEDTGQSGRERIAQRNRRPGEAGLANENRPGLGTQANKLRQPLDNLRTGPHSPDEPGPSDDQQSQADETARAAAEQAAKLGRKEPQEQRADSMAQEEQRSTGMSGQSSGV